MRLLITAGPTREPLDAVRYLSNRSSGRMGLALAAAGISAGHDVTLLLGPGPDDRRAPAGCRLKRFETTANLQALLETDWPDHDVLIMAAAVADYRPAATYPGKLPRHGDLNLALEATPDLVAQLAADKRPDQRVIAFALEPADAIEARAAEKLERKGVDAVVANPLETMDAQAVEAHWLAADGEIAALPAMSKADFARWLMDKINPR